MIGRLNLEIARLAERGAGFWMHATERAEKRVDVALVKAKERSA